MNSKEYLKSVRKLDETIHYYESEIARIDSMLGIKGISYNDIPSSSGNPNNREHLIISKVDLIEKLEDEIENVKYKRQIIWKNIEQYLEGNELQIIRLRYFEYCGWNKIARLSNYSRGRCIGIHNEAINKLNEHMTKYDI